MPRGRLLGTLDLSNDITMYCVVLAIVIAAFALIVRTIHSPFGQVLKAVMENEPRAISLGYDVDRYKLLTFVLSAALWGLAGATKTLVLGFETLTDAHWTMSGLVVLMTLVTAWAPPLARSLEQSSSSRWKTSWATLAGSWRRLPASSGSTRWATRSPS